MFSLLVDSPLITGISLGLLILLTRLFVFSYILRNIEALGSYDYLNKLKDVLNSGHSLVLYDVRSDGKEPRITNDPNINDPLRIEDDLIAFKSLPLIFFDPKTMKIKGYFHALNADHFKDKYSKNVYEGYLTLVENTEKK